MGLNIPRHWAPSHDENARYSERFVTVHDFRRIGSQMLSKTQCAYDISDNDMVYEFGATPIVLTRLWKLLVVNTNLPKTSDPLHLLWWMHFTKHYQTKRKFRQTTKWSHQTTKKWMTPIAKRMVPLCPYVINWENRKRHNKGRTFKTYHDGVDCRILQVYLTNGQPNKKYSGHKFGGKSGLRYGVSSCIQTGDVVAIFGPFPAGRWNDQKIYTEMVVPMLEPGEMVEVDKGYWGATCRRPDNYLCESEKRAKCAVAGRHESINGRFKNFRSLGPAPYRHSIHDHKDYFYTAAIVTQMMFEQYGTTFDVTY